MNGTSVPGGLIQLAIQETPAVLAAIKQAFARHHPDAPAPTDDEVMTAFEVAFQSSRARDEQWLAQHPEA